MTLKEKVINALYSGKINIIEKSGETGFTIGDKFIYFSNPDDSSLSPAELYKNCTTRELADKIYSSLYYIKIMGFTQDFTYCKNELDKLVKSNASKTCKSCNTIKSMIGRYYQLEDDEAEIKEIEKDLAAYINVPFVKCSYDSIYSHKHIQKEEAKYRKRMGEENGFWFMCDYIINYEKYKTKEDYEANNGGYDGEVYEHHYFKKMEITLLLQILMMINNIILNKCRFSPLILFCQIYLFFWAICKISLLIRLRF